MSTIAILCRVLSYLAAFLFAPTWDQYKQKLATYL